MNNKTLLKIARHCKKLANRKIKPQFNHHGLCREINDKFGLSLHRYIDFKKYPNFSSNIDYPIKSCVDQYSAEDHFDYYMGRLLNMWDGRTKYGKARLHFTKWISEQLFELAEMY